MTRDEALNALYKVMISLEVAKTTPEKPAWYLPAYEDLGKVAVAIELGFKND